MRYGQVIRHRRRAHPPSIYIAGKTRLFAGAGLIGGHRGPTRTHRRLRCAVAITRVGATSCLLFCPRSALPLS